MKRPQLAAIINLTPDSFSGDGATTEQALQLAKTHAESGADILDVGAESTRPGATPISADEEWLRLEPFMVGLKHIAFTGRPKLSIDTRHAQTAARALELGADIINDEGGLQDPEMLHVLRQSACDIVVMHALTLPADKAATWPANIDPIAEILAWKKNVIEAVAKHDIASERLIFDPGLGFGKTPEQSLALVLKAKELIEGGERWFYGHSRKSFLTLFAEQPAAGRDALTAAFSAMLAEAGVQYLRIHNIEKHMQLFGRLCT